MADATVQLAPDGSGKLVDNSSLTVAGQTVYRQRTNFADPSDALGLARVMATTPAAAEYGVVVRGAGTFDVSSSGVPIDNRPDGFLRVQVDPTTILYDSFDSFDTTNTWISGGTAPTATSSVLSVAPGSAASASSYTSSRMVASPFASGWLQYAAVVQIEAGALANSQRFFGIGTLTTPTTAAPIQNGAVYELDSAAGALLASLYVNGTRTQSVAVTRPSDGGWHRYAIYYRASRVYYEVDGVDVAVITPTTPVASGQLNLVMGAVNGSTAPTAAPVLRFGHVGLGDSTRQTLKIGDGAYPWRTVTVKPANTAPTATDQALVVGLHPSSGSAKGLQPASGNALPTQDLKDAGRLRLAFTFSATPSSGSETILTMVRVPGGAAANSTSVATIGPSSGKTLRLTSIMFSVRNTGTAAVFAIMSLRTGTAANPPTTSGPLEVRLDSGLVGATAGSASTLILPLTEGMEFTANQLFAVTAAASATTGLTITVVINGYEY